MLTTLVDADIFVDDVVIARTPLRGPLTVNVGRRRLVARTKEGVADSKVIDLASGELVEVELKLHAASKLPRPAAVPAAPHLPRRAEASTKAGERSRTGVWLAWTATAVCALGALTSGILAYSYARDLRELRSSYPVTGDELADARSKVRTAGLVADGLAAGTLALGAVSLTMTLRGTDTRVSIAPRGLVVQRTF